MFTEYGVSNDLLYVVLIPTIPNTKYETSDYQCYCLQIASFIIKWLIILNMEIVMSYRLQNYDYSSKGLYFVTICTYLKEYYFGDIKNGIVILSEIGKIAENELIKISTLRKNILLHKYCFMPNHIHVIFEITKKVEKSPVNYDVTHWKKSCLGAIVGQFKASVTKICRQNNFEYFKWQPRFYDKIIHDNNELLLICKYIQNNPKNWDKDKNR